MKIAVKLGLGYAAAILILLAIWSFSFLTLQQANTQWVSFEKNDIAKKDLIVAGNRSLGDAIHHFKNYVLRGGEYDKKFSTDIGELKRVADAYRAIANTTAEERTLLSEIDAAADAYLTDMGKLVQLRTTGLHIEELDKSIKGADKPIYAAFEKLQLLAAKETDESTKQFSDSLDHAKSTTEAMMLFALLTMIGLSVVITLVITRPLREALAIVNRIAAGELQNNIDINRRDEIGQLLAAMKRMSDTLKGVLADTDLLIKAVSAGDLDARANADQYRGDYRNLVAGFNEAISSIAEPIKVASAYVDQIANGIIPAEISTDYQGEYRLIRDNLNTLVKLMGDLLTQTDIVIQAAASGELDKRADAELFLGDWNRLVQGINRSLDHIVLPVNEVVATLAYVEQGDLTHSVKGNYQGQLGDLKDTVNNTVEQLAKTIAEVIASADQLGNASEQISATSQSLSLAASEQAAGIEETSSGIEQMAATIAQNAENAKVTGLIANQAAREAAEGGVAVKQTMEAMKAIASKISIIDDIAYQTNMLALNAAIEAARAGDHGKGFAVVAAEVRKLAERSQIAAEEIGKLAETSVKTAESAGSLLEAIVPGITKTSGLVQEIAAASQEQSAGVNQINTAMNQMNQVTQQNAAASEQLAATAEELTGQAEQLQTRMGFFKIRNAGSDANPNRLLVEAETDIDLDEAIQAHDEWKIKLSSACQSKERMDSAVIRRDDCCKLGKWLHGRARRNYRHLAAYSDCIKKHAAFHLEASKVAEIINNGQYATAETLLKNGGRYAAVSSEVCKAIAALQQEAGL